MSNHLVAAVSVLYVYDNNRNLDNNNKIWLIIFKDQSSCLSLQQRTEKESGQYESWLSHSFFYSIFYIFSVTAEVFCKSFCKQSQFVMSKEQGNNLAFPLQGLLDFLWFLLTDVFCLSGGRDGVGMKQDDDTSFTVKIQGAGIEPFEMQVENQSVIFSLFLLIPYKAAD